MARSFLFLSHDNKLGDAIVLTGLLNPIKQRWPDATIGVVCGPANAVVYRAHPGVDHVHVARSRSVLARLVASLSARRRHYDQLVHFGSDVDSPSLRTIVRVVGAQETVLFFEPSRPLAAHQHILAGGWFQRHTSDRHLQYLKWLGLPLHAYRYDLRLPPASVADAARFLDSRPTSADYLHIVIACDASTADRSLSADWLERCGAALLEARPGTRITLLCASQTRHDGLATMANTLGARVGVAPLRPDAGLALALIARADLLLSPDTFAVHAASAFNIPVVAVYPGDAHTLVTWAPRSDVQLQLVAPPAAALAAHDPQAVAAACLSLLQQSREPTP